MEDNAGAATLKQIYDNASRYYPNVDKSKDWKAGLRGVLYRDIGKTFKKIDTFTYGLM